MLAISRLQQLLQFFASLGGLKKDYMCLQQGVGIRPQLQLGQPQCHLIGTEDAAAGQLNIQQPVFKMYWLRPILEKQELLLWLLAQYAVLHTEFVVGQLDFFNTGQCQ